MPRILYTLMSNGFPQGGHKVAIRHVETLRELGFDARCYVPRALKNPSWLEHQAAIEVQSPVRPDDIIVIPDDDPIVMQDCIRKQIRTIIFVQNPFSFAASKAFELIDKFSVANPPSFIAVGERLEQSLLKSFPNISTEFIPCFADERLFQPAWPKRKIIAFSPRKRMLEARAIRNIFQRRYSDHADFKWAEIVNRRETEVAAIFKNAGVFLSLSRLESVGMTPLEAMACGCVCAGFNGIGGREYATPDNGFWVEEDDCEAAVDALNVAVDLVLTGGAALRRRVHAGYETAAQWSFAKFRNKLEDVWNRLAPEARHLQGSST